VPDFVVGIIERKLETVYQMQQAGQLNITYENMRKVEGLIILGYYHLCGIRGTRAGVTITF